ncbi:fasciclin domain-containing protein [Labilibaculum sp. K2S]|uniref:fasciclin domain-containing protein n=1 Tax=Labilibaculum sp. K2S TaxID=3056386 RepID=UPI0025A47995|nr:fasciclin domain-containing protein [Labilibaculum sp. K2S]MDM8161494.1 fasciclin domain-containing protein [Labilibaculum sp. K2S]
MKKIKIFFQGLHLIKIMMLASFFVLALTQCEIQPDFTYEYNNPGGKLEIDAWQFIQETDDLSLMEDAITLAGLSDLYSGSDQKTFIVPRNSAWESYLSTNSYASIADIPVAILQNTLKYHIVKARVIFSDPDLLLKNNPIAYDTENDQVMYLSHNSNFIGIINEGTSKSWTIVTSNLEPTNGVIHVTKDVVYLLE